MAQLCYVAWDGSQAKELVKIQSKNFVLSEAYWYCTSLFRYIFLDIDFNNFFLIFLYDYHICRLVTPIVPKIRPIGMGLGADKVALPKQDGKTQKDEKELQIEKGSFIKIIAGKRSNAYGQVEGFDDAGRLIVKMALNGNIVSVNECITQVVTKTEYSKNSKVLS